MSAVRLRILLILALLATVFIAAGFGWQAIERQKGELLSENAARERRLLIERILRLQAAPLETMVAGFATSDEMIRFVRKPNPAAARRIIDPQLASFQATSVWVFSPRFNLLYSVHRRRGADENFILPAYFLERVFQKSGAATFYVRTPDGVLEVHGVRLNAAHTPSTAASAVGYVLVGRLWDNEYLADLGSLTGTTIRFRATGLAALSSQEQPDRSSTVIARRDLPGWNGAPIARAEFASDSGIPRSIREATTSALVLFIIFALLIFGLLSLCLMYWVGNPLSEIATSLRSNDPKILAKLRTERTEFGELARLVTAYFGQVDLLEVEISHRRQAEAELEMQRANLEVMVDARTKDIQELNADLARSNRELTQAYDATIEGWSRALDLRDKETEGHSRRVTEMSLRLAEAVGMPSDDILHLRRGALLHDIGKISIRDDILLKPGALNPAERLIMERHPRYAYEMLSPITFLRPALDIPYCHHEKWDGTGYPRGLKGEEIPLAARIFAIVDVWDALRSDRPYRKAWPDEKVLDYIHSLSGTHFDPDVVVVFLQVAALQKVNNTLTPLPVNA